MQKGMYRVCLRMAAMGLVWGLLFAGALNQGRVDRIAKRTGENPFLLSNILRSQKSLIDHSLVDRMRYRKV